MKNKPGIKQLISLLKSIHMLMKLFIYLLVLNLFLSHLLFISILFLLSVLHIQWILLQDWILFSHSFSLIACIIWVLFTLFFLLFLQYNHQKYHLLFFNNHCINFCIAILNIFINSLNNKPISFIPSFIMLAIHSDSYYIDTSNWSLSYIFIEWTKYIWETRTLFDS